MTALMRRTPAEDDCSFCILKLPSSFVFATCGPHVTNTKELGSFKIQKEQSSSAGVRRIKAVIGNM